MKTLVVADLHGRDVWKDMINKESPDQTILLGDYLDSFSIPWDKQLANLLDIFQYKLDNIDTCELFVGNHCLPYLGGDSNISGYQYKYAHHYESAYRPMWEAKHFKACYALDNYLFSHAGITKQWCQNHNIGHIIEDTNALLYTDIDAFSFQSKYAKRLSYDSSGDNVWQSPTWVRPISLKQGGVDFWDQVVGHTPQKRITIDQRPTGEKYHFCDTQDYSGEYLVFIDGILEIHAL